MTIWGCCYCIKENICCKFCICSCYCLVCWRMTCIKSWCCFLDCSSFLLSASSRRFCSCISSISHFCMRSFFSGKYATVSLPPLRRFALAAVSFSTSSFLCIFCVPPRFSFPLLWRYRVSFCHFALFLQPQLLFLVFPQVLFQRPCSTIVRTRKDDLSMEKMWKSATYSFAMHVLKWLD